MEHYFCIRFYGSLEQVLGKEKCIKLEECSKIGMVLQQMLSEKRVPLGLDDLLVVSNGRNVGFDESTCNTSRIEVYRLMQGG